jgi:hypothetical protein
MDSAKKSSIILAAFKLALGLLEIVTAKSGTVEKR